MVDAGEVEMPLPDGEDPSGRVAVVSMAEAKELRKLAALHNIQKPLWLVLDEQEDLEFSDESVCPKDQTVNRKVYFEKTGPYTRFVLPLRVEAEWPIGKHLSPSVSRLSRSFTDTAVWKAARRNGQRVLDMAPSLTIEDVRANGWQEATGYVKVAKGTEHAMLNTDSFSGKALITAETLQSDSAFLRHWIERNKEETAEEYLERVRTSAKETAARIVWRRGQSSLGLEGDPGKEGYTDPTHWLPAPAGL